MHGEVLTVGGKRQSTTGTLIAVGCSTLTFTERREGPVPTVVSVPRRG